MKKRILSLLLAVVLLSLAGCKQSGGTSNPPAGQNQTGEQAQVPELPEFERYEDGVPVITVYNTASQEYENMDAETYVMGVLAGEMRNDWPMEALRAQAILARTFTLKFISEKDSMYPYADISTDVTEAQAYDASAVNERVRRAVEETRGEIMSYQGELPYAWFHAHAAGKTDLASVGLHFDSDPGYIRPVESRESDLAPTSVKNWTAVFDASEVLAAARKTGASLEKLESIELGEKGESGRAIDLLINAGALQQRAAPHRPPPPSSRNTPLPAPRCDLPRYTRSRRRRRRPHRRGDHRPQRPSDCWALLHDDIALQRGLPAL